jgi:hypothetical protein
MTIAWIVFACVCGGALFGMVLRRALPEHHLSSESRDVVKLGTGLVATMAALVLSLLIASAKSSYEAQRTGLEQMSASIILLGVMLEHMGPEAAEARAVLRRTVVATLERAWPTGGARSSGLDAPEMRGLNRVLYDRIEAFIPQNDAQRGLQARALQIAIDLGRMRWLLIEEGRDSSIPMPFLVVLVFWLAFLFVSFGLHAAPNLTVVVTQLLCALSVSGAIFLILNLDRPYTGLIQLPSAPLRDALARLAE